MNRSELSRQRASELAVLHQRAALLLTANAWDAGSARLLCSMGFESIGTSSGAYALAQGLRDGQVGQHEMLAHAAQIVAAVNVPVNADLENGFGHAPAAVVETLHQAIDIGLAGGMIEDTSGDPDAPILARDLAIERVAAGVQALHALEHPFVFSARTDVMLCGNRDLDEAIVRLQGFERVGAQVLCATGLPDMDAVRRVCAAVSRPVAVVIGSSKQSFDLADLAEAGVRRVSQGSTLLRQALSAVVSLCEEMRDQGTMHGAESALSYKALSDRVVNAR